MSKVFQASNAAKNILAVSIYTLIALALTLPVVAQLTPQEATPVTPLPLVPQPASTRSGNLLIVEKDGTRQTACP